MWLLSGLSPRVLTATPQSVKNMLGHLAYVLEGVTSLSIH